VSHAERSLKANHSAQPWQRKRRTAQMVRGMLLSMSPGQEGVRSHGDAQLPTRRSAWVSSGTCSGPGGQMRCYSVTDGLLTGSRLRAVCFAFSQSRCLTSLCSHAAAVPTSVSQFDFAELTTEEAGTPVRVLCSSREAAWSGRTVIRSCQLVEPSADCVPWPTN